MKILRFAKSRMTGIITQGLPVYGTNAGIVEKRWVYRSIQYMREKNN
jgi:hypothetical protein